MTRGDKILIILVLLVTIAGTISVVAIGMDNDQKYVSS